MNNRVGRAGCNSGNAGQHSSGDRILESVPITHALSGTKTIEVTASLALKSGTVQYTSAASSGASESATPDASQSIVYLVFP